MAGSRGSFLVRGFNQPVRGVYPQCYPAQDSSVDERNSESKGRGKHSSGGGYYGSGGSVSGAAGRTGLGRGRTTGARKQTCRAGKQMCRSGEQAESGRQLFPDFCGNRRQAVSSAGGDYPDLPSQKNAGCDSAGLEGYYQPPFCSPGSSGPQSGRKQAGSALWSGSRKNL